ncbi:hypothetical protein ACJIZ3_009180 [Penstemon smallii]|uniref:Pentatricopeptide repeat-containing protein n=1 Tax=Penstemon smallii TaxID=265156 RepID=A0ABD3TBR9_9LAMI
METDFSISPKLEHYCCMIDLLCRNDRLEEAIELRSNEPGVHALLSNIHASMGQWSKALQARKVMEENGIWKQRGSSSII